MLDEHAGSSVGALRHNGFLKGFGIKSGDKQIVCVANGGGNTADSQTAMENCLQKNPNIDVVYTINEPSAAGAWTALKNAGKSQSGTHDRLGRRRLRRRAEREGGRDRRDLSAVSAADGVAGRVGGRQVREDRSKASGYTDTGVNLIAKQGRGRRHLQERRLRPRQLLGVDVRPFRSATGAPSCAPVAVRSDST